MEAQPASSLAAALVRLFSLPPAARAAMGARGRAWVLANFNTSAAAEPTLRLYEEIAARGILNPRELQPI